MNTNMKTLALAVGLAVMALGSVGAVQATPLLQITQGAANPVNPPWPNSGPLAGAANQEAIGDNGGTNYANGPTPGASNGPGMPTALGGWPIGPGFAVDAGLPPGGGNLGISGWDQSYLNLTQAGNVTFQFMGKGDAQDQNQFWVFTGGVWNMLWDSQSATNGTCGVSGTSPLCTFPGSQQTFFFNAPGLIPFYFINVTSGDTAINDGTGNPADIQASFFLGVDPYLASGPFNNTGTAVYAGFTDGPCLPGGPCDHDYEDLVVRVSVPEPGSLFLLGTGLLGLAGLRRRKA